jgi:hypothetical protein
VYRCGREHMEIGPPARTRGNAYHKPLMANPNLVWTDLDDRKVMLYSSYPLN